MSLPDPAAASAAAVRLRRERAAVKRDVAEGRRTALEVCESAWNTPGSAEQSLLVTEVLGAMRGQGPVRTAQLLDQLGISSRRRLRGLGIHQRERLRDWLYEKEGSMQPRLVVLAGPTAVGKGTVAQYVRDLHASDPHCLVAVYLPELLAARSPLTRLLGAPERRLRRTLLHLPRTTVTTVPWRLGREVHAKES